ncbi:anti-sigma factor family protein [Streptomyces sp. NPDC002004]
MSPQQRHQDVAAYALGVLEPADSHLFEEHLADCVVCAVRLGEFTDVARVLAPYAGPRPAQRLPLERPAPELLDRVLGEVARLRRRAHGRWLRLTAVAAALAIAGPAGVLALRGTAQDPQGPDTGPRVLSATDAATGVSATVTTADRRWGTDVGLTLARAHGPLTCRLLAVGTHGEKETVATWAVPQDAEGAAGHEPPVVVHGGTALHSSGIDHFEVRTVQGGRLVSVGE